jgi:hypothetical protein
VNDDLMGHAPVELSTKPHLRPDGEYVLVTLTQRRDDGANVIQLTPEQAHSLFVALRNHLGV